MSSIPGSSTQPMSTPTGAHPAPDTSNQREEFTLRIPKPGTGGNGEHRSALRTTEFWMTIGLVVLVLLSTYLDEDTLNRAEGWRFATWAIMAYVISRGLSKLGNRPDAGSERKNIDVR